jgi:hypothetical protein
MKPSLLLTLALLAALPALHAQEDPVATEEPPPPVALIVPEEEAGEPEPTIPTDLVPLDVPPAQPAAPDPQPPVPDNQPLDPPAEIHPDPAGPSVVLGAPEEIVHQPGLTVRVEKLPAAATAGTLSAVKLHSPFPPKPLAAIPAGWVLRKADDTKPFIQVVDLGNGNLVTVSIPPFVLSPDDSQRNVFSIREPGHKPALTYRQVDTIGALLTQSTQELDDTDAGMTEVIGRLNQLLLSFPQEPR